MDIKQYITSGILELYVLERLEPAEMREVEANALQHPEIRSEIDQIEQVLEAFAIAAAPEVSPEILDRLLKEAKGKKAPASTPERTADVPTPATSSSFAWIPWLLAIAALAALLYAYTQLGNRTEELQDVQGRLEILQKDCDENQEVIRAAQQRLNEVTNPATQGIILAGTDNAPDKQAIVFYNQATNKTLFKAVNLPPPPAGKQYQLWAIDADGPKDLGVLALDLEGNVVLEVNYLPAVAAFAITLEDEGGKPAPDLSTLQVYGDVAG
ncbi:anti-sigma factor [Neolewinella persica]|uniref:anti-sigma factor n=1 Tax=Neolewinella persica TaxID=70998 RepID=UPI00036866E5|nr:anti-sigma factor [Neolewinella persica]